MHQTMSVNGVLLRTSRVASFRMAGTRARDRIFSITVSNRLLFFPDCADHLLRLFKSIAAIAAISSLMIQSSFESDILPAIGVI